MPQQIIATQIKRVRRLLSRCAETFDHFDREIVRVLCLADIRDYSTIIDSFYLFEDTELAKAHVRSHGLGSSTNVQDFGLVYLKFYGVINVCYCAAYRKADRGHTGSEESNLTYPPYSRSRVPGVVRKG